MSDSKLPLLADRLFRAAVCLTLLARGWLTWRWDSPVRGVFWSEDLMTPLLTLLGTSWEHYAATSDAGITLGLKLTGGFLMLCSMLPWLLSLPRFRWAGPALGLAAVLLLFDAFARYHQSGFHLGMALEHALQWGSVILLLLYHYRPSLSGGSFVAWICVLAAATFTGHGLYAVGYHPVPLNYRTMIRDVLNLGDPTDLRFLLVMGWLDFVGAAALCLTLTRKWALLYMVAWGGATAIARPLAGDSLDPWVAEALVRTTHWALPLVAFLVLGRRRSSGKPNCCEDSHSPSAPDSSANATTK